MATGRLWTKDEVVLALALYEITPSSKISGKNPAIMRLAQMLGRSSGSVSFKIANLLALDKSRTNGPKGFGNCSQLDRDVFETYWDAKSGGINLESLSKKVLQICESNNDLRETPELLKINPLPPVAGEDVFRLTKQRMNQSFFRTAVLANCNESCVISHCALPSLLEAAHILPWSDAESSRLSVANGIALNPLLHKAYDLDLLGITADGKVIFSEALKASTDFYSESLQNFDGRSIDFSQLKVPVNQDFLNVRFEQFLKNQ